MSLILLGRDNPYGADPKFALYPLPSHATGARLYAMIAAAARRAGVRFSRLDYVALDRRNLVVGRWTRGAGLDAGQVLRRELDERIHATGNETSVVCLGADVRDQAFPLALSGRLMCSWHDAHHGRVSWIPHPSGRNRLYGADPDLSERVGTFVWRAIEDEQKHAHSTGLAG